MLLLATAVARRSFTLYSRESAGLAHLPARNHPITTSARSAMKTKKIELTEPQMFWLRILLETTLSAADRSKATASYEAVLAKLK
jgi:hypothetical protein